MAQEPSHPLKRGATLAPFSSPLWSLFSYFALQPFEPPQQHNLLLPPSPCAPQSSSEGAADKAVAGFSSGLSPSLLFFLFFLKCIVDILSTDLRHLLLSRPHREKRFVTGFSFLTLECRINHRDVCLEAIMHLFSSLPSLSGRALCTTGG